MTSIQPNIQVNTQSAVQPKQMETKPKEKSSISTNAKIAIGTGLTALAAIGIYIATKGKGGKNLQNIGEQIESLISSCKNLSKRFNFETPQIGEKLEEISKLPKKERLEALKELETTLNHADGVRNHIENHYGLSKGMKELPEDVRQAYEQKDVIRAGELYKQHLDKLPNARPAVTKGATVAESIENTFGKNSNIQPHTYDLSKESPVIGVYRNFGGYKDGAIGQEGRYYVDNLSNFPDEKDLITAASHAFSDKNYGSMSELGCLDNTVLENPDRKLVRFAIKDGGKQNYSMLINVLSPNNEFTPLQKDLIKLMENPEKIDLPVLHKLTEVAQTRQDMIDGNLYKNLDYDVLLSAIQSMAK